MSLGIFFNYSYGRKHEYSNQLLLLSSTPNTYSITNMVGEQNVKQSSSTLASKFGRVYSNHFLGTVFDDNNVRISLTASLVAVNMNSYIIRMNSFS